MNPDWPLVALAVWDVVPVVVSTIGFIVLARLVGRFDDRAGSLGWAAVGLIALGGASKPVFKFTEALTSGTVSPTVLDNTLFWLLAPGFLVAVAGYRVASAMDRGRQPGPAWPVVGAASAAVAVAAGLAIGGSGRGWFFWLLTITTLANIWWVVVLARWARARGDATAAVLFSLNLAIVIGLSGAAAAVESTITVQWAEQSTAVVAQGLFTWGAVRLSRVVVA